MENLFFEDFPRASDDELNAMEKDELIKLIRELEHNIKLDKIKIRIVEKELSAYKNKFAQVEEINALLTKLNEINRTDYFDNK